MQQLNKKTAVKWGIIALVIAGLLTLVYHQLKPTESAPNYLTATAHIGDIENSVMASGKIKALTTVDVGAQVSGEVTQLFVDVGDEVKKGDLIAQIDKVTQTNNLANQHASLIQSQAGLQSAKAEVGSRRASLNSAYADLNRRQATLKQALSDFARLKSLIAIDAISRQEYDTAATKVAAAKADVSSAKAAIDNAKAALITAQSNVSREKAALQKSQSNLNTAIEKLGHTTIRAPMDGTVVSVTTKQGATVNANQSAPTIVTLADLSTIRINTQISEADVVNVKAGMPVYFNTIGNPDQKYNAVLTAIEPAPEKISTTSAADSAIYYVGYIEVPNPDKQFRIDMTAQVFIIIDQAKDALLVPATAIKSGALASATLNHQKTDPSKAASLGSDQAHSQPNPAAHGQSYYVRLLTADGKVENKAVTVGINNRIQAQILSGLKAGDKVIIGQDHPAGKSNEDDGESS